MAQLWHSHTLLAPFIFIKTLLYRHGNKRCRSCRRYHRFFEDIILDALWQRRLDHWCSIRTKSNAFPPFLSLSFFVHHSVRDIKFFTVQQAFSIDNLCNSRQFVRDFRFSDPSIIRFCFNFITLVLFLLFDSLKNNDVEKQEQIFEDGDSTISINRFRVRII